MEYCETCGGTRKERRACPCMTCNGVGRVLSILKNNPWPNITPATEFNKSMHTDYYEHVCPQCHGRRVMPCNNFFHID
jgi:DnaJ-class molecular chaperone